MSGNNVIMFPKMKREDSQPQTAEEMMEKISKIRENYAEEILVGVAPILLDILAANGVDVNSPNQQTLNAMMIECVRAKFYKSLKMEHPFHEVADKFFKFYEDEVGTTYSFNPNVNNEEEGDTIPE